MSMDQLPLEILDAVLGYVGDKKLLLKCRLLSRNFERASNPHAFKTLVIYARVKRSRDGFRSLANSRRLALCVRKVVFTEYRRFRDANGDVTFEELISLIKLIANLEGIIALTVGFRPDWDSFMRLPGAGELTPSGLLQIEFFKALAETHSHRRLQLQCLEIRDLITLPNRSLQLDAFKELLRPITTLDITTVSEKRHFGYDEDQHKAFWAIQLTGIMNAAQNLKSWTLRGTKFHYDWSTIDSKALPPLTHLNLENFVFSATYSPKDFVLHHKKLLRHLDIRDCDYDTGILYHKPGSSSRFWADMFKRFEEELERLLSFRFDSVTKLVWKFKDAVDDVQELGSIESAPEEWNPLPRGGEGGRSAYASLQRAISNRTL